MRYVADKDGHWVPYERESFDAAPYVQPDIAEYGGRYKWREYLKRTGSIEMGHSDLKAATEKWQIKKQDHAKSMKMAEKYAPPVDAPPLEARYDYQRTRLNAEIRNRLEGRPAPPLPLLVKMTLEEARRKR